MFLRFSVRTVLFFVLAIEFAGGLMQVDAVLFDLFDTLLLLEKQEAYYLPSLMKLHEFLVRNGVSVSFDDFSRVYFEVREKLYSESRESLEEPHFNVRIAMVLRRFGYDAGVSDPIVTGATAVFCDEFTRYVTVDADALPVLQKLYGKYKLGLISNFALPECAWKLLDRFDLKRFFGVVVISGEINRRKPSAEIFQRALKALKVRGSRAVFVGDMPDLDVVGPKKVGMKTILIERRPVEHGVDAKPDYVIRGLNELLAVLADC
jgi:putative hydrolase of the HAD superfamily